MPFSQRLPLTFFAALQEEMRARMEEAGLDLLIADHYQDVSYATGFSHYPNERPVAFALTRRGAFLLVPELEREYAAHQHAAAEVVTYFEFPGVERPFDVLARVVGAVGGRAGYSPSMEIRRLRDLRRAFPGCAWEESGVVDRMRLLKKPEEVALHQEAARISDDMVRAGAAFVRERLRENRLPSETELSGFVIRHGIGVMQREHTELFLSPKMAGALVYSGANSAFPHGMATTDTLRPGDCFMLSLGCAVGGRFAESERTFFVGEPTQEQRRFYQVVQEAQHEGVEAMVAGRPCHAPNTVALDIIRQAGFGGHIRHRLGHGIGMGNHEPPWIEGGDDSPMEPGMVLSAEPAVYVPGLGGFRISDTVLVTGDAPRRLTDYPRDIGAMVIA